MQNVKKNGPWRGSSNINPAGTSVLNDQYTMNDDKTAFILTAQWVSVDFNLMCVNPATDILEKAYWKTGYGLSTMSPKLEYGKAGSLESPSYKGYVFVGWYKGSVNNDLVTFDTLFASPDQPFNVEWTTKTTLYSKWEKGVAVSYVANCNDSELVGDTIDSYFVAAKYNSDTVIADNKFERDGYTFAGWNTQANGEGTTY